MQEAEAQPADQYADLSDPQALEAARESFPEAVAASVLQGLPIDPDQHVVDWIDNDAAVVSTSDPGHFGLLDSTMPLRDPDEAGVLRPLDLSLDEQAGGFAPQNALLPLTLPASSGDPLELGDAGLSVDLGASETTSGVLTDDHVFYPNTDTDTDTVAVPRPSGIEVSWIVRSADAPNAQALQLSLPEGMQAEEVTQPSGGDAAIVLVRDGEQVGFIPAPRAQDAAGQPVPVSMELGGSTVEVSFPHADADYTYPLLVDPSINWNLPGDSWKDFSNASGFLYSYPYISGTAGWWGFSSWGYVAGLYGEYYRFAPAGAYVYRAEYDGFGVRVNHSRGWAGILSGISPDDGWEAGYWEDHYPSRDGAVQVWTNAAGRYVGGSDVYTDNLYVTSCARPGCAVAGTPGNVASWGLRMTGASDSTPGPGAWVDATTLFFSDDEFPQVDGSQSGYNGDWVESMSGTATVTASVGTGLGMGTVGIRGAGVLAATHSNSVNCTLPKDAAAVQGHCPFSHSATLSYDSSGMSEGITEVDPFARNLAGNESEGEGWEVRIDRSPPQVDISGQAWTSNETLAPGLYGIDVHATDGNPDIDPETNPGAFAAAQRSGVQVVRVLVDPDAGGPKGFQIGLNDFQDPDCPIDSCPLDSTYELDTGEWGTSSNAANVQITVKVMAMDKLGHWAQPVEKTLTIANEGQSGDTDVTYDFGSQAGGGSHQCQLDGGTEQDCSSPKTYQDVSNGSHEFGFR